MLGLVPAWVKFHLNVDFFLMQYGQGIVHKIELSHQKRKILLSIEQERLLGHFQNMPGNLCRVSSDRVIDRQRNDATRLNGREGQR